MDVHDSSNHTWRTGCIYNGFTIEILHISVHDSSIIAFSVNNSNFILMPPIVFLYIIFFHRRYNPLCVLAFSMIFFHSALSLHNFLHPLIRIICIPSSMSSIHLFLGLPLFLLPVGFHCSILLGILFPSIRITWPSQAILLLFTILTISAFFIRSFSS